MHVWALTLSEGIPTRQLINVASGKWNWKSEVRSGRTLTFHDLLFHIFKIFHHTLCYPRKKEIKTKTKTKKHHLLLLPRTSLLTGYFWQDIVIKGTGRDLFSYPGVWNPGFPLSWRPAAAVKRIPPALPTQKRNPLLPF